MGALEPVAPVRRKRRQVPNSIDAQALEGARQDEAALAARAAAIRGDATILTPHLFMALWPLLREPIPAAYIQTIPSVTGKPYESTGLRSVQVQHDRMNNVLTPLWWAELVQYEQDGKLCKVSVLVRDPDSPEPLLVRSSYGGVDRGSTVGNVYKGSYTNAAKLAFARVGPGHEIYVGALDLDPDVSEQAAAAQAKPEELPGLAKVTPEVVLALREQVDLVCPPAAAAQEREGFLRDLKVALGAMGVPGTASVNEALAALTPAQAQELSAWLAEKA